MSAEKMFIHQLYEKYYGSRKKEVAPIIVIEELIDESGKGRCIKCKHRRKLCKRGATKGQCKRCRKGGV